MSLQRPRTGTHDLKLDSLRTSVLATLWRNPEWSRSQGGLSRGLRELRGVPLTAAATAWGCGAAASAGRSLRSPCRPLHLPGTLGLWPPRSLDPISSGSRRPRPHSYWDAACKFPPRENKSGERERGRTRPPSAPPCLRGQADLTGNWEPGARGLRLCATRAAPKWFSLGREWDSTECPGNAGEWRSAPPCSRRESPHRAGDRSFVARTPVGRAALRPGYPFLFSCPARKTQPGMGGKVIAK